jgi:hypothetical protein
MFWFDKDRRDAVFVDNRAETHSLKDKSSRGGSRTLTVQPSVVADFRKLPFMDETFSLVVFDPPHLMRNGHSGWMAKKYGTLNRSAWQDDLAQGFAECFRVCRTAGTVTFKWNHSEIPVREVLNLTKYVPVVGTKNPTGSKTSWFVFLK